MNKRLKYYSFLFFIVLFGLTSLIVTKSSFGATTLEEQQKARDGLTQEGLVRHQLSSTIFEGFNTLAGVEGDENDPTSQSEAGAIQFASYMIGSVYGNPPVSGVYYAQDVLQNLGVKSAYAQGVGFTGLQPILPVWKAFRNVTYVLFTLIFVGVGLAIMLRVKISPQAVISIENAIPRIIGALILVTFSYAIAGFMIDLMYVLLALVISILKQGGIDPGIWQLPLVGTLGKTAPRSVIGSGFFSLIPMFFGTNNLGIGIGIVSALVGGMIGTIAGAFTGPGALATGTIGLVAGPVLIALIWLVVALILLFKLFFGLIKAYINIILAVILGPFQIMLGAIPGLQVGGFGSWFKGLLTEIIIFPAVLAVAMIGAFIIQSTSFMPGSDTQMWIAPLIGPPDLQTLAPDWLSWAMPIAETIIPGLSGAQYMANVFIRAIIGMGFLLILAKIPDIIRQAMKKESPYGAAIGQALAPIPGTTQQLGRMGGQVGLGAGFDIAKGKLRKGGRTKLAKAVDKAHQAARNLKIATD